MESNSSKLLKAIGWAELVMAASLLYVLVRTTIELFWPTDRSQTYGEWLPLVVPIVALLFTSLLLPGIAAVRSWRHPWWWQSFVAIGVLLGVFFTVM
jgi:hypothetical protein